jgi:CDGSH-type Zn-finger protein
MESMASKTVGLCRCCGLTTESVCDGTYSKFGFFALRRVVRQEEGQV